MIDDAENPFDGATIVECSVHITVGSGVVVVSGEPLAVVDAIRILRDAQATT